MSFGHLKDVSTYVVPGQWLNSNQILVKTNLWYGGDEFPGFPPCYDVNYDTGVHTHIEMWTAYANRFACFKDHGPSGVQLPNQTRLGDVGRAIYANYRSPCGD
jgi:hypothetical protein